MKLVSRMAAGLCMSSPRFLLEPVQLGDSESGSHIILIPLVSASLLSAIVDVLEQNRRYRNLNPHSDLQLGRRNLYRRVDRRLESGLTRASGC